VRHLVTPDMVYDEVSTNRKVEGLDAVLSLRQGWAQAFPDSRATFHNALASGTTVVLEMTWKGTHQGPMR
jgi:predicted ester cyclase